MYKRMYIYVYNLECLCMYIHMYKYIHCPCQLIYNVIVLSDVSTCLILDAKTMSHTPVCEILLPQRVPYGFHGIFVPEADLVAAAQ